MIYLQPTTNCTLAICLLRILILILILIETNLFAAAASARSLFPFPATLEFLGFLKLMASPAHFDDVSHRLLSHVFPFLNISSSSSFNLNFTFLKRRTSILEADLAERIQVSLSLSNALSLSLSHTHTHMLFIAYVLILSLLEHVCNIGEKRPSPDYDDEDYDHDPFGPKKVILHKSLYQRLVGSSGSTSHSLQFNDCKWIKISSGRDYFHRLTWLELDLLEFNRFLV